MNCSPLLEQLLVRSIMTPAAVTVRSTTPLVEAGQIFLQKKFGCLPVVHDNNTLAGIVTVTDLLRASIAQHEAGEADVCKKHNANTDHHGHA